MPENYLYFGDNLDILRRYIKDESVDLVYLDPPFNSKATYNVLFAERDGSRSAAQIKAFGDTWKWDQAAVQAYTSSLQIGGQVAETMRGFHALLGNSNMMAYVAMMAPRLIELRRVLKPTGSIYLHCDPTASHYLKLLMDGIFGPTNFKNEIVWKRTAAHSSSKRFGPVHDVILFYAKSNSHVWNSVKQPYGKEYVEAKYRQKDERGLYMDDNLTGTGLRKGDSGKPWREYDPSKLGRHWALPGEIVEAIIGQEKAVRLTIQEKLDVLDEKGYIHWTTKARSSETGFPRLKRFLGDGLPAQDVITDIPPINSQAQERLGYPTQKPEALLERIIRASSYEGDTVLDPFCGCGTAVAVAHRLKRKWVGIDITYIAIDLIKRRLDDAFGRKVRETYDVTGEPTSLSEANALAQHDRYQFQLWALGLVDARSAGIQRGADRGIDGRLYFHDEGQERDQTKQVILSVKSGGVGVKDVRDLNSVVGREGAAIGVLITLEEPTRPMRAEAAEAGEYIWPFGNRRFPKIQILTVQELLDSGRIDMPPRAAVSNLTFRRARKAKEKAETSVQNGLPFEEAGT